MSSNPKISVTNLLPMDRIVHGPQWLGPFIARTERDEDGNVIIHTVNGGRNLYPATVQVEVVRDALPMGTPDEGF